MCTAKSVALTTNGTGCSWTTPCNSSCLPESKKKKQKKWRRRNRSVRRCWRRRRRRRRIVLDKIDKIRSRRFLHFCSAPPHRRRVCLLHLLLQLPAHLSQEFAWRELRKVKQPSPAVLAVP